MEGASLYITVAIGAFILLLLGLFIFRKKKAKISPLLNISLMLIILSLFFEKRVIAYPIIGLAVIIAVVDAFIKLKKKR
jgi:LPXTG-motif cell wall-anchored protein